MTLGGGERTALVVDTAGDDWEILRQVAPGGSAAGQGVRITTNRAAYSCCARSWLREGYEQHYEGAVLNVLDESFMLGSPGIGTWNFIVAVSREDLLGAELL